MQSVSCKKYVSASLCVGVCVFVCCLHGWVWESVLLIPVCMLLCKNMHVRTPYCVVNPPTNCVIRLFIDRCVGTFRHWLKQYLYDCAIIPFRACYCFFFKKQKSTSKSDARKHIYTNKKWKNTMSPKRKTQKPRVKVTEEWYHKYTIIRFLYLDLWFVLYTYNTIHLCKKKRMVT